MTATDINGLYSTGIAMPYPPLSLCKSTGFRLPPRRPVKAKRVIHSATAAENSCQCKSVADTCPQWLKSDKLGLGLKAGFGFMEEQDG